MDISVFWFLVHAHDHVIVDQQFGLEARRDAARILWRLAVDVPIGARMEPQ